MADAANDRMTLRDLEKVGRGALVEVEDEDPQELMARITGNYRRGNERVASQHPRNRQR